MDFKKIDFGKVILKALELIIIKPLTLPFKVYYNSLVSLSNSSADDSEESNLSEDFPLYVWFLSIFNAIIVLSYPIGLLIAIYSAYNSYGDGFKVFLIAIIFVYFYPLFVGLIRELLQITLKILLYLKIISKNN